ncbi:MAG: pantoate--beta-alanine ligase [Phycisphaeraceae bacterium]|nr:pantoate--beta-alanine ligase [Phycisphaeraceae bacterium]
MRVITDRAGLEALEPGALVPTMGALHAGHAALIRIARTAARTSALPGGSQVTIFVNPRQFNDPRDYETYPRTTDQDLRLCEREGVDAVIIPSSDIVYPEDGPKISPAVPAMGQGRGLEDAGRPGHFEGVCAVLFSLFKLTRCAAAVFGEKDWQQLQVARALSEQERLSVQILPGPTVRDPDGLALSSRNVRLTNDGRRRALSLSKAIHEARKHADPTDAEHSMRRVLTQGGVDEIGYASVRHAQSLLPMRIRDARRSPGRALITAVVEGVRLLDNGPWGLAADASVSTGV